MQTVSGDAPPPALNFACSDHVGQGGSGHASQGGSTGSGGEGMQRCWWWVGAALVVVVGTALVVVVRAALVVMVGQRCFRWWRGEGERSRKMNVVILSLLRSLVGEKTTEVFSCHLYTYVTESMIKFLPLSFFKQSAKPKINIVLNLTLFAKCKFRGCVTFIPCKALTRV